MWILIDAQVDHFKAGPFEHHAHQVLADVVQVSGYGAQDDFAGRRDLTLRQVGLQDSHARLHGARGDQHLGHKHLALFKEPAHFAHGGDAALVQDIAWSDTRVQACLDLAGCLVGITFQNCLIDAFDTHFRSSS